MSMQRATFGPWSELNTNADQKNLRPDQVYSLSNGYINKEGSIQQRGGSQFLHSSTLYTGNSQATKLFPLKFSTGNYRLIFSINGIFQEFVISGATFKTVYNPGSAFVPEKSEAVMFNDYVVLTWGGIPKKATYSDPNWTAATLSSDSAMPQDANACFVFNNRLWMNSAGNTMKAYASKVGVADAADSWSKPNDALTIDFTKVIQGDVLLGFQEFNGLIAFLFRKHIVLYSVPADFYGIKLVKVFNFGVFSKFCAYPVGSDLIIMNDFGVFPLSTAYDSIANISNFTSSITKDYRDLVARINEQEAHIAYYPPENHIYFYPRTIDSGGLVYIYDLTLKRLVGTLGLAASSFVSFSSGISQTEHLYMAIWTGTSSAYIATAFSSGNTATLLTKDYITSAGTGGNSIGFSASLGSSNMNDSFRNKRFIKFALHIETVVSSPASVTVNFGDYSTTVTEYSKPYYNVSTSKSLSNFSLSKTDSTSVCRFKGIDVFYYKFGGAQL